MRKRTSNSGVVETSVFAAYLPRQDAFWDAQGIAQLVAHPINGDIVPISEKLNVADDLPIKLARMENFFHEEIAA